MSIDRRITNGLAWAGVLLVVGVPTADLLSAQLMGNTAPANPPVVAVVERVAPMPAPLSQRPSAPVVQPAAQVATVVPAKPVPPLVTPAKPAEQVADVVPAKPVVATPVRPAAQTADAVDAWLNSGKALPGYITDESQPTQVVATPPARTPIVTTPSTEIDPIEVAAIPPQKVAPTPMPLSMRPRPVAVAVAPPQDIVIPSGLAPATPAVVVRPPGNVTANDLEDWETGPLSEFLAQRQAGNAYVDPNYDADGFYLDQGPNRRPRTIRPDVEDEPFFLLFD
jgi:hypothetical protein